MTTARANESKLRYPSNPCVMRRREFIRLGLAGVTGLSLPQLYRLRASAAEKGASKKRAILIVWLPGGASHLETYDPKPDADSAYRGPFGAISTSATGLQLSELLPKHSQVADKFTILRSMVHTGFCHQQGTQQLLTGHPVRELKQKPDHPDILSITNHLRADPGRAIPNYIGVPSINYSGAAYLGPACEPFVVSGDPNTPTFEVPNVGMGDPARAQRLRTRLDLKQQLDHFRRDVDRLGNMQALDAFEGQAWNLLTSQATRDAFDLTQEKEQTRDRYGRNTWGQQCLLSRRLLEAGVELVTTQFGGPLCGRVGNWDDHAVNHNVFEAMQRRALYFDQAVAALIEDLYERGLDERVLLVVTGEFGRTPKINYQPSTGEGVGSAAAGVIQPGRDHWPNATSILFAGGGMATGHAIGATDARGAEVTERRVGTGDFLATLYRHLGIDPDQISFRDFSGRPTPILQNGSPIKELASRS